jgi:signal transduction histidine kinase
VLTGLLTLLSTNDVPLPEPAKVRCTVAQNLVRELLNRVRTLSFDLRPAALDQLGLIPALLSLFERYSQQTGVRIDFRHRDVEGRYSIAIETAAFRIVQEALTNVARHAQTPEAEVRVWATDDVVGVRIEDRGRGFDPNSVLDSAKSSGLAGMQERAKLLGSQVVIESREGGGTVITAELPLQPTSEPLE